MANHEQQREHSLEEQHRLEKVAATSKKIEIIREDCIDQYHALIENDSAEARRSTVQFLREQAQMFRDYYEGLSYGVSAQLNNDEQYKKSKAEALLSGVDIMLMIHSFREAYNLIEELLPLTDASGDRLRSHITGVGCLMNLPLWNIHILRQTGKIRKHIQQALLTGKDMQGSEIRESLDQILYAIPVPEKDIEKSHASAQAKYGAKFAIPSLIEDILLYGKA